MVHSVSNPGISQVVYPAKQAQNPSQSNTASGAVGGSVPAAGASDGKDRPVRQAPEADAEKQQPKEEAKNRPVEQSVQNTQLSIAHDTAADRYVYQDVEQASREVRDQWPSEQDLKRIALLRELTGKIVDKES